MNLLLIEHDELPSSPTDLLRLGGRRATHVREVLRADVGARIKLGVVDGPIDHATVVSVTSEHVDVTLDLENAACPPRPRATIILAMVRPQIMKRTLQHLATLGVREILLVGSRRVEKSYFSQRLFDGDQYREHLKLGLEQAGDTWMPKLSIHPRFRPFIEDEAPQRLQDVEHRVLAHPGEKSRSPRPLPRGARAALAIGPEGGWIDYEVDRFIELGFVVTSLGPRILKVETAVPYLFGALGL